MLVDSIQVKPTQCNGKSMRRSNLMDHIINKIQINWVKYNNPTASKSTP